MSKKYIITIKSEYEDSFKGLMILGAKESNLFVDTLAVEDLEELNSDYINEHFGGLQEDAYQQGLDDAWEAAKKLFSSMADSDIDKAFPIEWNNGGFNALMNLQPQEAIEKLKAYEEKQKADDEIKVGDEVERYIDGKFDSKGIYLNDVDEKDDYWNCLFWTGACFVTLAYPKNQFKKTGKHYDISSILKEMQS